MNRQTHRWTFAACLFACVVVVACGGCQGRSAVSPAGTPSSAEIESFIEQNPQFAESPEESSGDFQLGR